MAHWAITTKDSSVGGGSSWSMEVRSSKENPGTGADVLIVLSMLVVAVGLAVAGVVLLVTCETTQFVGPFGNVTIGCSYPFQSYGLAFLYAASLVVALEAFPVRRVLRSSGDGPAWDPKFVSVAVAAGATFLFIFVYIIIV